MKKVAVSFVGTKDAALYFDEVIPLAIHLHLIYDLSDNEPMGALDKITADRARDFKIAFDLLPKAVSSDKDTLECLSRINDHFLDAIKVKYINRDEKHLGELIKQNISPEVHTLFRKISNLNTEFVTHPELVNLEDDPSGQLMVSVSGLRLIDTSKASVEQIIAFREDTDSQKKIRRLRAFVQENYVGKSLEFIEDDLMRRIDDYENEASKWGFEIREAALTNIFGSKSMPMIAGSTLLAALAGSPVVATSAAIAGSIFELGKVAIAVSRKRFERYVALRDSPVSYITTAISELEKPKDS